MTDVSYIFEGSERNLLSSSRTTRIAFFNATVNSALEIPESNFTEFSVDVASLFLRTIPLYEDRQSIAAVERSFLKALSLHSSFLKPFTAALVQAATKFPKSGPLFVKYKLLRWTILLLRRNPELFNAKNAFSRIFAAQATLCTQIFQTGQPRIISRALQSFLQLLRKTPDSFSLYLEQLNAITVTPDNLGIILVLVSFSVDPKTDPAILQRNKPLFLELYSRSVLGSREPLPQLASMAFEPILKKLRPEEFSLEVAPTAVKMLKRNPELILNATCHLVSVVPFDSSKHLADFLPTILQQVRVNDEGKKRDALNLLKELSLKCSNLDSIIASFESIKKIMAGSEGKLTFPYQRVGMINSLQVLASSGGNKAESSNLAREICEFATKLYQDEVSEEVKISLLAAIGDWLARTESTIPKKTSDFFQAVLKDKDSLRRAGLRCLRQGFRNPNLRVEILPLVDSLMTFIKSGMAKGSQRVEGVYSLLLVASIAIVDRQTDDKLTKEKVWALVLSKDSPLLSSSVLSKLSSEDILSLAELVELILMQFPTRISGNSDGERGIYQLAVSLLWNPSLKVRQQVQASIRRCHLVSSDISASLLNAFTEWLPLLEDKQEAIKLSEVSVEATAPSDPAALLLPSANLLQQALVHVVAPDYADRTPICSRIMLAAHHPLVVRGAARDICWKTIVRNLDKRGVDAVRVLASDAATTCTILLGFGGLLSTRSAHAQAAINSVATCMKMFPAEFFPHLLPALQLFGDRTSHDALTAADIKIYETPEGVLSTEQGIYVAEVVRDKNVRQARGRMKMYDDGFEGEELSIPSKAAAPALRPSQVKSTASGKKESGKPAKKSDADKSRSAKDEARDNQLREESIRRSQIQAIKDRLTLVLKTLASAAIANPPFAHDQLPVLESIVLPLLKSKILAVEAYFAMVTLTACLAPAIQHLGTDIATAVCTVSKSDGVLAVQLRSGTSNSKSGQFQEDRDQSVVERVVDGLVKACRQGPLPAASFAAVFPIIEAILMSNYKTWAHNDLLNILSMHTSPYINVPRERMIVVLFHVLEVVPVYSETVLPVLRELCQGIKPPEVVKALSGLFSVQPHVRAACLEAIKYVPSLAAGALSPTAELSAILWMAQYDPDESNVEAAETIWDMYSHELSIEYAPSLISFLSHENFNVRRAAALGLAAAMDEYPKTVPETLTLLFSTYVDNGSPQSEFEPDASWTTRQGVALALHDAADVIGKRDIPLVITFLISKALADANPEVRAAMVEAGAVIVQKHGKDNVALLLPIFENYLDKKSADESRYDMVREGVVVFLGALAQHFSQDSVKVNAIIERLMDVLNTPSESVQRAVSECLPPLMPSQKDNAHDLVQRLLFTLMESDKYGERRGAAFGLAGVAKGLGISALKEYGILESIKNGMETKNSAKAREGALFGIQALSEKLGRLFEPYAIHIIPWMLACYSDGVMAVREALAMAAKTIMGQLTGHGVKLVLPALLQGLNDKQWRTKQGSVQLLGAMAFCAPKQLSHCLPTIVPHLSQVLTDSHPKVQAAAQTALQQVGSVIRNPEISALVPSLLTGIADPNEHTKTSLDILLQTTFVNSVDAASLALLAPIVHRGLRERSADVKKKAAQITGNLCSLATDHRDMLPYLRLMMPELKKVLVDPHPEVRSVAAKSLGLLMKGMGEANFKDMVPWLLKMLKSDISSVERSGAAQGFSEVIAVLGKARFEALLPEIIDHCSSPIAPERDGYLTLFKYLPSTFGPGFQKYLPKVLPAILGGLADENDLVRDAALSAGHIFVEHYAITSLPLLLPAVEEGIINDNWRIRQNSVELLGDLLFKVVGASGKVVIDGGSDDEGASTEAQGRAITEVLGQEKRDKVLAAIYMIRSDVTLPVRQAALHVWKTIVANTPKTLKEIMPVLMQTLITSLASDSSERRQVAGRSIGELVKKLGERVLPSVIPILASGLDDDNRATRQGVCIGLSEVMGCAGKQQLAEYMSELIPTIRKALCDDEAEVREAAGQAFSTLYKNAGLQAIDEIVPALLLSLEDPSKAATGLDGLKQILGVRTAAVLPHILPKLVELPLTAFNAHALGALAEVAGAGLNTHLSTVLPPLIASLGESTDELLEVTQKASQTIVMTVDEEGLTAVLAELFSALQDNLPSMRKGAAELLAYFCRNTKMDLEEEIPELLTTLILLLTDNDESVVKASLDALSAVLSTVPKENLPQHLKTVRDAISTAKDKERRKRKGVPPVIPGLALPKALQPILPVYLQGLMSGSAELREQAADGLGELIDVTSESTLKPFVVQITGPLIRIIGDRFPWQVKTAILGTLYIIILKGGIALKPFVPQLQTTFLKCLQDPAKSVRSSAAKALGRLSTLNPRVDPLVNDLLNGIQNEETAGKGSMVVALRGVSKYAGKRMSPIVLLRASSVLQGLLAMDSENIRLSAGRALGIISQYMEQPDVEKILEYISGTCEDSSWVARHGAQQALSSLGRHSSAQLVTGKGSVATVVKILRKGQKDDQVAIREIVAKSAFRFLVQLLQDNSGSGSELVAVLSDLVSDDASAVRRAALAAIKDLSKAVPQHSQSIVSILGPKLGESLKDPSQPVRLAAERTAMHLFKLAKGQDNVLAAQRFITGLDARRISKLNEQSDESGDSEGESLD